MSEAYYEPGSVHNSVNYDGDYGFATFGTVNSTPAMEGVSTHREVSFKGNGGFVCFNDAPPPVPNPPEPVKFEDPEASKVFETSSKKKTKQGNVTQHNSVVYSGNRGIAILYHAGPEESNRIVEEIRNQWASSLNATGGKYTTRSDAQNEDECIEEPIRIVEEKRNQRASSLNATDGKSTRSDAQNEDESIEERTRIVREKRIQWASSLNATGGKSTRSDAEL